MNLMKRAWLSILRQGIKSFTLCVASIIIQDNVSLFVV